MAQDPNKLPKEETTPQEQKNEETQTHPFDYYPHKIESLSGQMQALIQKSQQQQAEIDELIRKREEARKNRTSLVTSMIEQRKPNYDTQQEKRQRAAVIIQSLGDVLAAATKGAIAYGRKGAGVVPQGAPSNAMEGVQKISDMQQKYLQERKAWEDLMLNWEEQKSRDEVAAAEALLTQKEKEASQTQREYQDLQAKAEGYSDKMYELYLTEYLNQKKREESLEDYKTKKDIDKRYAPRKSSSAAQKPPKETPEDDADAKFYYSLFPARNTENQVIPWNSLSEQEKETNRKLAKGSAALGAYLTMLDKDVPVNIAREKLSKVFNVAMKNKKDVETLFKEILTDYSKKLGKERLDQYIESYLTLHYPAKTKV